MPLNTAEISKIENASFIFICGNFLKQNNTEYYCCQKKLESEKHKYLQCYK